MVVMPSTKQAGNEIVHGSDTQIHTRASILRSMDAIAGLLDGPRARSAFMLRVSMDPPWCLDVRDDAPLTVIAMVRGEAWITPGEGEPVPMRAGDVAIALGSEHYLMGDDPATAPTALILPNQGCVTLDGQTLAERWSLGVRNWGNAPDGEAEMLIGTYQMAGEVSGRLLRALPVLAVLREEEWDCPVIPLLADEIGKDEPGQEAVLDRLLDLLLIAALRAWFARPDAPDWYRAHSDPVVGRALRLLQHNPAHQWTVAELARETGMSRAALARRFHELVGEPPMAFLTSWRIALAADLLLEPGSTIGSVAEQVGYGSPFALSTAFKRVRGISPQQHRAAAKVAA
jgi:AraC-like DNA-binding protein